MSLANFTVLDLIRGDRTLNAAALSAILEADPTALTAAALASVLASPGAIGGTVPGAGSFAGVTNTAATKNTPSVVAAAGATQGNATAIGASVTDVIVTVTASTEGVKLPTAVTGKRLRIWPDPAVGVKLYPGTNGKIGAAATNVAVPIVKNKAVNLIAKNTTQWLISTTA